MQIKDPQNILRSVLDEGPEKLTLEISGIQTEMRLLVASDLHCNFDDERGIPFQQYTARMNRCSVHRFSLLEDAIQQARQGLCDAILLPGDLLSFPSAAGVEKFAEIISNYVDVLPEEVTEDSRFIEDLGFNSYDFMSFLGEIEQEFDIVIDESQVTNLQTVGDAMRYIASIKA